jgi:hypothetical protein
MGNARARQLDLAGPLAIGRVRAIGLPGWRDLDGIGQAECGWCAVFAFWVALERIT